MFEWRSIVGERVSVQRLKPGWGISIDGCEVMASSNPQAVASFASFLTTTVPFALGVPRDPRGCVLDLDDATLRVVWHYTFDTAHPLPTVAIGRATQAHLAAWLVLGWEVGVRVDLSQYGREGTLCVRCGTEAMLASLEMSREVRYFSTAADITRWVRRG